MSQPRGHNACACRTLSHLPGTHVWVTYPLSLGCELQLCGFQVQTQECSAVGPPSLEASDSSPGSKWGAPARPDGFCSAGHFLVCICRALCVLGPLR